MNVAQDTYNHLVAMYAVSGSDQAAGGAAGMAEVACSWMRSNQDTWSYWQDMTAKNEIFIGGIFPHQGPYKYLAGGMVPGMTFELVFSFH